MNFWGFVSDNQSIETPSVLRVMSIEFKSFSGKDIEQDYVSYDTNSCKIGIGYDHYSSSSASSASSAIALYSDEEYVSIFCGTLYNSSEIANQLYGERSNNIDNAHLVVDSFRKWEKDVNARFNGKYSFVIIHKKTKVIYASHDHFGKSRLFYYHKDGTFIFSSRIEPIIQFPGIEKQINTDILGYYFRLLYIPSPWSIFRNVYKLTPGSILIVSEKKEEIYHYWRPSDVVLQNPTFTGSYSDALGRLEELLIEAVHTRLKNAKRVGALLSSGIDSSLIAALLQKEYGGCLTTFTIGFKDVKYNEADLAKKIAGYLGTNHKEYYISEDDLLRCVDSLSAIVNEPLGDSGLIPMMVVSQIAAREVDVAFGGDGGDELFEGYLHYHFVRQAQAFDLVGALLRCVLPESTIKKMPHRLQHVILNRDPAIKTQLVIPSELKVFQDILQNPILPPYYAVEDRMSIRNWELRRQVLDMETGFTDDAIQKSDLATQYGELDLRSPLIDYRVATFSLSLPCQYKSKGAINKRILRDLAYKYVPRELLDLPKRGFCIPIDKWMKSTLSTEICDLSTDEFLAKQGIFNGNALREAISKNFTLKWNFFVFQKWYEKHFAQ